MKFNLHLFEYELSNLVTGSSIRSSCFHPKLECVYLLEPSEPHLYSDILYVAPADVLVNVGERIRRYLRSSPNLSFACICIGNPPDFLLEAQNCDVIWIDGTHNPPAAFNAVQRVIRRYDAWEKQLATIATSGGGITELVDNSVSIFKNDICVTDHFSRVLAYKVYRFNMISAEDSSKIVPGAFLPHNMIIDGIMDEVEGRGFSGDTTSKNALVGFSKMRAFNCDVLQYTINVRPEYSVILSIHSNYQVVGEHNCAPLIVLGEAIRRSCVNYGPAITNDRYLNTHSTLKALLEGEPVSNALLLKCASTLQWDPDSDEMTVYCITLEENLLEHDRPLMRPFTSICNHLQVQLNCPSFVVDDCMVLIANFTQYEWTEESLTDRLSDICIELHLIAGASGVYPGLRSLVGCYQRAHEAMRSLIMLPSDHPILHFSERAIMIAMSCISERISPEQFCSRAMLNLARREPELYKALEAYLRLNCNANEASKALGIQRSTFVYRLGKAREIVDTDLADYDDRLLLMLSCKLIEMFGIEKLLSA